MVCEPAASVPVVMLNHAPKAQPPVQQFGMRHLGQTTHLFLNAPHPFCAIFALVIGLIYERAEGPEPELPEPAKRIGVADDDKRVAHRQRLEGFLGDASHFPSAEFTFRNDGEK